MGLFGLFLAIAIIPLKSVVDDIFNILAVLGIPRPSLVN